MRIIILVMTMLLMAGVANAQSIAGAGAVADQTQTQGQSQGNTNDLANIGNSAVSFNNAFNGAAPIRYLPVPSAVSFENQQPGLFGRPDYEDKGPDFVSMRQLVAALNAIDLDAAPDVLDRVDINTQIMGKARNKRIKKVDFALNDGDAVNHGFVPIALFSIETRGARKANSASLAMAIGRKARELGANKVVFLTEGSSKELSSWGVGIGLSYNHASVGSAASDNGSVGAGGTGWSMGKGSYQNLIYLTALVGY